MKKRMHSFSANSRQSRAMTSSLRNSQRHFFVPFGPFSIGIRGSVPLTRFRQVTHMPKTGRVSSQSGPRFGVKFNPHIDLSHLKYLDAKGVERLRQSLPPLTESDMEKICHDRKVRREVMFAKGVSGGSHRPPTYNFKSLVRCSK